MEKEPVELDPVAKRLLTFVQENGGYSKVAKQMDKHPQLFYNIRDGKSKPSMDTLREVALAYPGEFDLNWVILGDDYVKASGVNGGNGSAEGKYQEDVIERLMKELKEAKDDKALYKRALAAHLPKEQSFKRVTRNTTGRKVTLGRDIAQVWRQGFNEKDASKEKAITQLVGGPGLS